MATNFQGCMCGVTLQAFDTMCVTLHTCMALHIGHHVCVELRAASTPKEARPRKRLGMHEALLH